MKLREIIQKSLSRSAFLCGTAVPITDSQTNKGIMLEIGRRIRAARIDRSLARAELALLAGSTEDAVAKAESGDKISLLQFIQILRALRGLENLELVVPDPGISDRLGKTRFRASLTNESILAELSSRIRGHLSKGSVLLTEITDEPGMASRAIKNLDMSDRVAFWQFLTLLRKLTLLNRLNNVLPE